jgi:hypothetical protein
MIGANKNSTLCGIETHYIAIFIIIVVIILLGVCVCEKLVAASVLLSLNEVTGIKGGSIKYKKEGQKGGFTGKPKGVENILLVDVANMYVGWYMEKYNKRLPYNEQCGLMQNYVKCMRDHYKRFAEKNDTSTDAVNYIIKNYKYIGSSKKVMLAPIISKETWGTIYEFVKESPGAHVTVAEDYQQIPHDKWKTPKFHYLRGRDDYLCFRMAQQYKKKYINSVIMSNDKYKDYEQFGMVPEFLATYVHAKWGEEDNAEPEIVHTEELVKPRPNTLGQMRDYGMVKITMEFQFKDPKFLKTSEYKIAKHGNVWV